MVQYKTDENGQLYIQEITKEEIILYSTGCPKCKVLERKLHDKGIYYTKNKSLNEMERLGFTTVPVLYVSGKYLKFNEAVKWINEQEE